MRDETTKDYHRKLREAFLHYLTFDSETNDARRREFNQAIFDPDQGWACFNGTDLDMVMAKFDKAVQQVEKK